MELPPGDLEKALHLMKSSLNELSITELRTKMVISHNYHAAWSVRQKSVFAFAAATHSPHA